MSYCPVCGGNDSTKVLEKDGYDLVRCRSDGHVYVSNPPAPGELAGIYGAEYFDGTADVGYRHSAFEMSDRRTERARRRVAKLRRLVPEGSVLDVGCGPGFFLNEASAFYDVSGCDISRAAAEYAKSVFDIDVQVTDFLDYQNGQPYDAVTMFSQLEHTADPRANLQKANGLLVDGGLLLLSLPNFRGLPHLVQGRGWRGLSIPEHLNFFDSQNLRRLLAETGFTPVESRYLENNFFRDTNYFYATKI